MDYIYPDELYHYGVKGQKWGQRRYQNPDGTLTEAGKAHYGRRYTGSGGRSRRAGGYDSGEEKKSVNWKKVAAVGAGVAGAAALGYGAYRLRKGGYSARDVAGVIADAGYRAGNRARAVGRKIRSYSPRDVAGVIADTPRYAANRVRSTGRKLGNRLSTALSGKAAKGRRDLRGLVELDSLNENKSAIRRAQNKAARKTYISKREKIRRGRADMETGLPRQFLDSFNMDKSAIRKAQNRAAKRTYVSKKRRAAIIRNQLQGGIPSSPVDSLNLRKRRRR